MEQIQKETDMNVFYGELHVGMTLFNIENFIQEKTREMYNKEILSTNEFNELIKREMWMINYGGSEHDFIGKYYIKFEEYDYDRINGANYLKTKINKKIINSVYQTYT